MKSATIAIGGNAILKAGEEGTLEQQLTNLAVATRHIAHLASMGYRLILTHGNGPQVGNLMLQNDIATDKVPAMPLYVCVAQTQGQIGFMIQQSLANALEDVGLKRNVCTLVTRVLVAPDDPAFKRPTKPVGGYYDPAQAKKLMKKRDWKMVEDKARGGFRRVVASPDPVRIIESPLIKRMLMSDPDTILVVAGGGGIPVIMSHAGLEGVEAVIDKDRATGVLAGEIGEELLVLLSDVECAYIDFGSESQKPIGKVRLEKIKELYHQGQFPPGSMGPKIETVIKFIEGGGKRAIITTHELLVDAIEGLTGTEVTL